MTLSQFGYLKKLLNDQTLSAIDYSKVPLLDFIIDTHRKIYAEEFIVKPFHHELCDLLTKCAYGTLPEGKYIVIINLPFRFSKTQLIIYFIMWCFLQNEGAKFIYSSYSDKLSLNASRDIKNGLVKTFHKRASFSKDAAQLWTLSKGGALLATTSLGSATGFGSGSIHNVPCAGCLVFDDPIKPVDAYYATKLNAVNENLVNTFWSRRNQLDKTIFMLVQQRLNVNDQSAYLMEKFPNNYIRYCVKGIGEDGESVFPERVSTQTLMELKQASPYTFYSQVQQEPKAFTGGFFNIDMIKIMPIAEFRKKEWMMKYFVRSWDFAGTKRESRPSNKNDFTRGVLMCVDQEAVYILDMKSHHGTVEQNELLLAQTANEDGWKTSITIPEDPGSAGQFLTDYFQSLPSLSSYSLHAIRPVLNKQLRAAPFASYINLGKIIMISDDEDPVKWNAAILEEMASFPYGIHDDAIDACSDAFSMIHSVNKFI